MAKATSVAFGRCVGTDSGGATRADGHLTAACRRAADRRGGGRLHGAARRRRRLAAERQGIALTPDSFSYLGMARTLAEGHGYASPFGAPGLPAETGFPPLYPTLLAAANVAGVSVLRWAAWINAAAFAALIVLVAAMVYDLSRSALATVLGAALTLTFVPLLDLYVHVWSEPAYLVWQVLALWMLARYNARGARTDLAIAGVAASLAALTRYAGLALLPAGLIVLLAARRRPLRARLVDCAAYTAITAIPLGLWLVRNVLEAAPRPAARSPTARSTPTASTGRGSRCRAGSTCCGWARRPGSGGWPRCSRSRSPPAWSGTAASTAPERRRLGPRRRPRVRRRLRRLPVGERRG